MKKLRTNLKAIVIIASVIAMVRPMANAQDSTKKSVDFTTNVDLYSRYLWRGMQNGNAPAIQPTIKMTYKNFSFGAWGSVQASDLASTSLPETDLFATYTLPKGFSVTVNDYFVSADEANLGNYFDYDQNSVNSLHQIEGVLAFAGPEKFPLSASVGYTFYGQKWVASAPANMNGSIYAELDYQVKNLTIIAAGGNKYYTTSTMKEDFVPVNIGVKVVQKTVITDKFTLPITGQIMINPNTKHIYYTVGFSF